MHPTTTWKEYVELAFNEIALYGKDDAQTRQSLIGAIDYLLNIVPETHKPPLQYQRVLVSEFQRQGK